MGSSFSIEGDIRIFHWRFSIYDLQTGNRQSKIDNAVAAT
jgi:hypothetical protein